MQASDFSVVITNYNQAAFIREAINSALKQAHPAKEVIVVDDGSTDESQAQLKGYEEGITLITLPTNQGANKARNAGASKANGKYLVFLDGDDVMLPWALEVYNRIVMLKNPKIILSSMFFFSDPAAALTVGNPHSIDFCEYESLMGKDHPYRASASAIVVDRETFFEAGGWTERIFPMEDLDLIFKLGYSGNTIQLFSPPTKCYRVHAGNTVQQVRSCIGMLETVIQKAKQCVYPGGQRSQLDRYAFIGGPAWFWVKKAMNTGFYKEAWQLLFHSWPMIAAGLLRRTGALIQGRHPIESIGFTSRLYAR